METFHLSDITIKSNKLSTNNGEYIFYVDTGTVTAFDENYRFSLEKTGINVNNSFHSFTVELFQIYRGMVHYRNVVHHLDKQFTLNVTRGRIFINGNCRHFTVLDNVMTIDMITPFTEAARRIQPPRRLYRPTTRPQTNTQPSLAAISNDRQNTHNSKILDNLYNILVAIKNKTKIELEFNQCVLEIRDLIYLEDLKKPFTNISNGMIVLNYVMDQHGYIDRFQMFEHDVLTLVWNAVRNDNELKKIFYSNFISMYERDAVVCLTGRVSRLIDIFSGIVMTKANIAQIRREMMDKCVKIRNDSGFTDEKLKDTIIKQMYKDYVDSNILTKNELDSELNEWINDI
jgi:hypothetical protein